MARPLSVGTRWALLYTAVTLVALAIPIGFIYINVRERIHHDARLLLESYATEVLSELATHPEQPEAALREFTGQLRRITPELDYGAALYRADGTLEAAAGSLERRPRPLPEAPGSGGSSKGAFREGDDPHYPDLVVTRTLPQGFVQAAISKRPFARSIGQVRRVMALAAPLALCLSALSGAWLARRSLHPIARMTESARRIGGENLSERIPTRGTNDELDRLATTLNQMFDRLRDSMDRLRTFSADAAHQLKSPIARLQNEIEVTLEGTGVDGEVRPLLEGFLHQVVELGTSVGVMLRLARSESGLTNAQVARVDMADLLGGVVALFQPMSEQRDIALELEVGEAVAIDGDVAWLRQLFSNLVQNALAHTPFGGRVRIALRVQADQVIVDVSDTGTGIPESEQARIFDRFYRVASSRDVPGSGLGLTLARQIAVAHGGGIEVSSELRRGSTFEVRLPKMRRSVEAAPIRRGRVRTACAAGSPEGGTAGQKEEAWTSPPRSWESRSVPQRLSSWVVATGSERAKPGPLRSPSRMRRRASSRPVPGAERTP